MTDTYSLLKNELKVYYPDVTDAELNEITNRLIDFYTIGAKAVYETEKAEKIANQEAEEDIQKWLIPLKTLSQPFEFP